MSSEKQDGEHTLRRLSIAPDSGDPESTRDKQLEWEAGSIGNEVVLEFAAADVEGVYTAISKGTFSKAQARKLRDEIDEQLDLE